MGKSTRSAPENPPKEITARQVAERYGPPGKKPRKYKGAYRVICPVCYDRDPETLNRLRISENEGASGAIKADLSCDGDCGRRNLLLPRVAADFGRPVMDTPQTDWGIPAWFYADKKKTRMLPHVEEFLAGLEGDARLQALRFLDHAVAGMLQAVLVSPGPRYAAPQEGEEFFTGPGASVTDWAAIVIWFFRGELLFAVNSDGKTTERVVLTLKPNGIWERSPAALGSRVDQTTNRFFGLLESILKSENAPAVDTARTLKSWSAFFRRAKSGLFDEQVIRRLPQVAEGLKCWGAFPAEVQECDLEDLDAGRNCLGMLNGVVDFSGGDIRLLPPAEGRRRLVTRQAPVKFNPAAHSPAWRQIKQHWIDAGLLDQLDFLLDAFGHALRGRPDRCIYVLVGEANAGKTTLMNLVAAILGLYCTTVPPSLLLPPERQHKGGPDAAPGTVAGGPRIGLFPEPEKSVSLSPEAVKRYSGNERVTYRLPHARQYMTAPVTATIFVIVNPERQPRFGFTDQAIRDRVRFVEHPPRLTSDKVDYSLTERLEKDATFREDFFYDLLSSAANLPGPPEEPERSLQIKREAVDREMGIIAAWAQEKLLAGEPEDFVTTAEVWSRLQIDYPSNEKERVQGFRRAGAISMVGSALGGVKATRRRVDGRPEWVFAGWRFADDSEEAGRQEKLF